MSGYGSTWRTCRHCNKPIGFSLLSFNWVHVGTKAAYCNYPTSNTFVAQPLVEEIEEVVDANS